MGYNFGLDVTTPWCWGGFLISRETKEVFPFESELRDYKFFCFNGKVEVFKIDIGRFIEHHANYYDRDGMLLDFGEQSCPPVFE